MQNHVQNLTLIARKISWEVKSLEDNKNLDNMKVKKLVGSLITYEMKLKANKKVKGVALKAEANKDIESLEGTLTVVTVDVIT